MQPLTGIGDQPSAVAFRQLPVTDKPLVQALQARLDTRGVGKWRGSCKLMNQKAVKPLLTALQIVETRLHLKRESLL